MNFWKNKRVLVTGHTGFKGTWLTIWLEKRGAKVIGFSLPEYPNDKTYAECKIADKIIDIRGDVRNIDELKSVFEEHRPEIVFHLAAQPLVRMSYDRPVETLNTNIQGTLHVLECIRLSDSVKVAVMITSDKAYKSHDWVWGYRENDAVGGFDPYSCSKGCSELLIDSYRNSFFKHQGKLVASVRAGNVIGGGDWSEDRLIPDCVKALSDDKPIEIRNPVATRPWQHVLEPLSGYMLVAEKMWNEGKYDEAWNFGPHIDSIKTVGEVVQKIIDFRGSGRWVDVSTPTTKHESKLLSLDISKSYFVLGWKPRLNLDETIKWTVDGYFSDVAIYKRFVHQIEEYEKKSD